MKQKFVLGISGASGVLLGLEFLRALPNDLDIYLIMTESAYKVADKEHSIALELRTNITLLDVRDISASVASGSFGVDKMAIIPTSMNTLAKIACGISDCLLTRVASVMIKERKTLLLAPREMPFSGIALENMLKLSNYGVIISPPILGYYAKTETLEDMQKFLIGKWLDSLKIPNQIYQRWK